MEIMIKNIMKKIKKNINKIINNGDYFNSHY